MIETLLSPAAGGQQYQLDAMQLQPAMLRRESVNPDGNALMQALSRVRGALDASDATLRQSIQNLALQDNVKPQMLLLLNHRLSVHATRLLILKGATDEIGRSIQSIVNRS